MEAQRSKARYKKVEMSKVILLILLVYITLLTPFAIYLAILGTIEPLVRCIEGAFALTTISVGFYYWKAKAENLHKYHQDNKITMNGESNYD